MSFDDVVAIRQFHRRDALNSIGRFDCYGIAFNFLLLFFSLVDDVDEIDVSFSNEFNFNRNEMICIRDFLFSHHRHFQTEHGQMFDGNLDLIVECFMRRWMFFSEWKIGRGIS